MTETLPPEVQQALDHLLRGAVALTSEAEGAMRAPEAAALREAIDEGRVQLAVTMIVPSGAVRVGVVGMWPGERTLWSMTPTDNVLERQKQ